MSPNDEAQSSKDRRQTGKDVWKQPAQVMDEERGWHGLEGPRTRLRWGGDSGIGQDRK